MRLRQLSSDIGTISLGSGEQPALTSASQVAGYFGLSVSTR